MFAQSYCSCTVGRLVQEQPLAVGVERTKTGRSHSENKILRLRSIVLGLMCSPCETLETKSQSSLRINLGSGLLKLLRLLFQPALKRNNLVHVVRSSIIPDLLRDLHGTKMRAAHRTKVRELRAFLRQGLVVILLSKIRVEREVELVFPSKLEASLR